MNSVEVLRSLYVHTITGIFGATMQTKERYTFFDMQSRLPYLDGHVRPYQLHKVLSMVQWAPCH